jgi:hypothetical protein
MGFKETAKQWKANAQDVLDIPYEFVREQMVRVILSSYKINTSNAYENITKLGYYLGSRYSNAILHIGRYSG